MFQKQLFHNISRLSCRTFIAVLLLLFVVQGRAMATFPLEVAVEGIGSPLYENVMSRLKINIHKGSDRVSIKNLFVLHRQAEKDIRSALAPYGYYSPLIVSNLHEVDGVWQAVYSITQGNPVIIKNVSVGVSKNVDDILQLSKVINEQPFQPGDILQQDIYESYKKALVQTAFEEGFLDAQLSRHDLEIHRGDYSANIFLMLELGQRYKFGELRSTQTVIEHDLLSRFRPFAPGDPYRSAQLFEYQKNLYRAGYFQQVTVRGDIQGTEGDEVAVDVDIQPLEHLNKYTFGLGFATDTGARITARWENKLLNTYGHRLKIGMQLGEKESSVESYYEIPYKDPRHEKVVLFGSFRDQDWGDTETELLAVGSSFVYSTPKFKYSFGMELREEDYTIGSTDGNSTLLVPSLRGSYVIADNLINTLNGIQVSGSVRGASEALQSDSTFMQFTAASKIVLSPLKDWRVLGRGLIGITLADELDDLPPSLRFYAGGDNSVRGYGYKEIGEEDNNGDVVGGRYTLVGSIELEKNFSEYIAGAVFWDFGNATDEIEFEFSHGVGIGGRVNLPFGQVKMDLATAISESGFPVRLHLSVGGEF